MKLTNEIRRTFVRAVMADVKASPYPEKWALAALKKAVENLPVAVREAYNKYPSMVITHYKHIPEFGYFHDLPGEKVDWGDWCPGTRAELVAHKTIESTVEDLKTRVNALACAHTTTQKLVEAAPELAKYLPVGATTKSGFPLVVQDPKLIGDLKAAGAKLIVGGATKK